ncbi:MAG: hypothetical protein JNK82_20550 [Myxococcaceae bacterium]|nr:hypothetical protein [Myxococcaceae bacterium]
MSDRTVIASATNLLARGFLTVPTDRKSKTGQPVNGLFAVARALMHVLGWRDTRSAVAVVDVSSRDWPELLEPQLPELPTLLEALGFHVVHSDAEPHLVASYVQAALGRGDDNVVIVGVDKRYAQLVTENVWWYDANKDARYTPPVVEKRFNVGPDRVADWLALVGDEDQLPGVAGIGAKGATGLLTAHATVEAALEQLESLDNRMKKALTAARERVPAELARARLDRTRPLPAPLEACAWRAPSASSINAVLERLGFVELLVSEQSATRVAVCRTATELEAALPGMTTLHALLDDPAPIREQLAGIAVSKGGGEAAYVPAASAAWPALAAWLADPSKPKGGHDLSGTRVALKRLGVELAGVTFETACESHLTQPSGWAPHELPHVARLVLGRSLPVDDEVLGTGRGRKAFSELSPERAAEVAGPRAETAAVLHEKLKDGVDPKLLAEYLELAALAARMELTGLAVDVGQLDRSVAEFAVVEDALQQKIEAHAGHTFNVNSSQQLGKVLFEELKLEVVSHTKTGWSTSNEALERIQHSHPIVELVLKWRTLRRLRDNWLVGLKKNIDVDGRVHSRFSVARSFGGMLINSNPDLGRVPGRTEEMAQVRRAFVAGPGRLLMSIDFQQLGLYVLAHLTKDPALVEPLRARADLHRLTAAAVLDKAPEAVTTEERQLGKVINFATFAGQGPSALSLQLGLTPAEAKEYIARFDRRYAKVREFQESQLELVRRQGYLVTIAGRRWPVGGLESLDPMLKSYAERMAKRGTHEGSVADVSRRALLEADRALRREKLGAVPLLQVHDEVLFEVPEAELELTARVCSHAMRHAFELEVPLVVGVEAGPNWADLEKV